MRVASVVVVCVVAGVLLAPVVASAASLMKDYPLEVKTEQVSQLLKKDVVCVKLADGSMPTLNAFMEDIVPASLRGSGALPAPAATQTMVRDVVVPNLKNCCILNQGNLPLWLRVRATQDSKTSISEDRHERFNGRLSDPWSLKSYFITQYTVIAPVTKYHVTTTKPVPVPITVIRNEKHQKFHWVDP